MADVLQQLSNRVPSPASRSILGATTCGISVKGKLHQRCSSLNTKTIFGRFPGAIRSLACPSPTVPAIATAVALVFRNSRRWIRLPASSGLVLCFWSGMLFSLWVFEGVKPALACTNARNDPECSTDPIYSNSIPKTLARSSLKRMTTPSPSSYPRSDWPFQVTLDQK